jgi:glycosyltransferase involved in cell wall biosynthesis
MDVSVIIRTYNEAKWLRAELEGITAQEVGDREVEIVLVDSGSTDKTVEIAREFGCRILTIRKEDFTFGRSLNVGCEGALGDYLVIISGHCVPVGTDWLSNLLRPLETGECDYVYGRQTGLDGTTRYSEQQLFNKYFPERSAIPQEGFFANNANSALRKDVWEKYPFDEEVTGLEDMVLAKALVEDGGRVGYVAEARITHIHFESWKQVKTRYEREAIALQYIMPEVHIGFGDFLRYFCSGVFLDWGQALGDRAFASNFASIFMFRLMQFWGAYRGNNDHRQLSRRRKERYYYPR